MPLKVIKRKSTGALTISGTVAGQRIQRRAASDSLALAREEASAIEANILRTEWHGERRSVRTFNEALVSYLEATPRHSNTKRRLNRIRDAIGGDLQLSSIDQDAMVRLRRSMLHEGAGAATYLREVIAPLRAVLRHAHKRGWCDAPVVESPRVASGRTVYINPDEVDRLIAGAAPHLRPLITFLVGTGARLSEAIYLEWRDVDLQGARAIFWETKNGRRRVAALLPKVIVSLANMSTRNGMVFRRPDGAPYQDRGGEYGGQIKTAWKTAIRRASLDPAITPHVCRHTWASWHYAVHRDLLKLKVEGGWSSVALVERYAHLMPAGHEEAIRRWLGVTEQAMEVRA